jgi:hypothetical protein
LSIKNTASKKDGAFSVSILNKNGVIPKSSAEDFQTGR